VPATDAAASANASMLRWSRSENRSKSEPASQPVFTGSGAIGASVALIARIRACWTRVDLRLTGVARWSGRGLRGGIDLSTGRSIGSRRHIGSVSRNRGCLWRRKAVSRIRDCSGRIWRATIKTVVIITWGGATVQAKGCHGSCGSEHEHTHKASYCPGAPRSPWSAPAGPFYCVVILEAQALAPQSPRKGIVNLG
jgi:hypothetical protein